QRSTSTVPAGLHLTQTRASSPSGMSASARTSPALPPPFVPHTPSPEGSKKKVTVPPVSTRRAGFSTIDASQWAAGSGSAPVSSGSLKRSAAESQTAPIGSGCDETGSVHDGLRRQVTVKKSWVTESERGTGCTVHVP